MLKILGGEFKSRVLQSPADTETTRPYTARARESTFDLLRGWFDDASVLDLFAGVGTMGIEAVSRGARAVVLVERDRRMVELLRRNVATLSCGDRARIVQGDALSPVCLSYPERPVQVIFVDPPFEMMRDERTRRRVMDQVRACRALMADVGFLVLRSPVSPRPRPEDWAVPGFEGPEAHAYGRHMWVLLYSPAAAGDGTGGSEVSAAPPRLETGDGGHARP